MWVISMCNNEERRFYTDWYKSYYSYLLSSICVYWIKPYYFLGFSSILDLFNLICTSIHTHLYSDFLNTVRYNRTYQDTHLFYNWLYCILSALSVSLFNPLRSPLYISLSFYTFFCCSIFFAIFFFIPFLPKVLCLSLFPPYFNIL